MNVFDFAGLHFVEQIPLAKHTSSSNAKAAVKYNVQIETPVFATPSTAAYPDDKGLTQRPALEV